MSEQKKDDVIKRVILSYEEFDKAKTTLEEPKVHKIKENEEIFTINDISEAFGAFYDFVNDNADKLNAETIGHLKEAFTQLDKAWKAEADAHGVNFTKYPVKL